MKNEVFKRQTISGDIIRRMIEDGSLKVDEDQFEQLYHAHKKTQTGVNRFDTLSIPVTDEELQILIEYIDDQTHTSVGEIGIKYNRQPGTVYSLVLRTALRLVFQDKSILKKVTVKSGT